MLGKPRSKFGQFLDKNSITQESLSLVCGVSNSTISRLTKPNQSEPTLKIAKKIIKALNEEGYNVTFDDFWND